MQQKLARLLYVLIHFEAVINSNELHCQHYKHTGTLVGTLRELQRLNSWEGAPVGFPKHAYTISN